MIFVSFKDFVAALPPTGRLLGIDWGVRRTGTAVSDESREFVFPREILAGAEHFTPLQEIVRSEKIVGIIIGLPMHADGTDSDTTRSVRGFAEKLAAAVDIPITLVDERLSSAAASEIVGNRKLDAAAAAVILEDAISAIQRTQYV
ncbi:MAG: Holliday junction resolvase RuvX [Alphaproteobacteria bacterium]|nr:Holliday junction resolvase RuvX [Alphaproteobacteria bacterium]MCL2890030.1 Holliday junction resolvase RuvX [Alphaproteobacteria bacterium]